MPNYQNGKIYYIRSFKTDDVYIGSTTQKLCQRLQEHKSNYKRFMLDNNCPYLTSFEILKYTDSYIELIEKYPCDDKDELRKKEGYYQRELKCVNRNLCGRTPKEWREDNKAYTIEWFRIYRITHKDEIKERNVNYRINNREKLHRKANEKFVCDCGGKYTRSHKSTHEKSKKHQKFHHRE